MAELPRQSNADDFPQGSAAAAAGSELAGDAAASQAQAGKGPHSREQASPGDPPSPGDGPASTLDQVRAAYPPFEEQAAAATEAAAALPLFDLIVAVEDTRRATDEIEAQIRPLVQAHGRARADLAAAIVRGLLDGDSLADWRRPLQTLGIDLSHDPDFGTADRIGREFTTWLYLVAMKR
jgi:hypothetical protein